MIYKFILSFLYAVFGTFVAAEYFERKFKSHGFIVKDMYKRNKPILANLGGAAALVGIFVAIVLSQVIVKEFSTSSLLIFYFIVIIHSVSGLMDDLINTSNVIKVIAPYFMALPVALLVQDNVVNLFGFSIEMGLAFNFIIAPVYLLVVTNLINMHSGFNGLASGTSWLLMLALGIRTIMFGKIELLFYLLPVFGALTVLWFFDKYPAKMIWGNVGSMMVGSAIGAFIIVSNAEIFGLIILMPHIIDFLLYLYCVLVKGRNFLKVKFGKLRLDGTIKAPTPLKLKFLLPYYFRLTEKQTVYWLYLVTAVFCVVGLVVGV